MRNAEQRECGARSSEGGRVPRSAFRVPRSAFCPSRPRSPGFTLTELIVVIGIFALLLTIGAGAYMGLSHGLDLRGLTSHMSSVVRSARNTTLYEGAPASVHVVTSQIAELRGPYERLEGAVVAEKRDMVVFQCFERPKPLEIPRERVVGSIRTRTRMVAVGYSTVGLWHFEEKAASFGHLGRACTFRGGGSAAGKVGRSRALNAGAPGGTDAIVVTKAREDYADPFRLESGGRIEMWVRQDEPGPACGLLRRERSYDLEVGPDGILSGGPEGTRASTSGLVLPRGRTESYALPLGRWVKVALMFSPNYVGIYVDGVLRGERTDVSPFDPPGDVPLLVGEGLAGWIDELKVQRRVQGEEMDIPGNFQYRGPAEIRFDERGRLDPALHTGAVTMELVREKRSLGFRVLLNGAIEYLGFGEAGGL